MKNINIRHILFFDEDIPHIVRLTCIISNIECDFSCKSKVNFNEIENPRFLCHSRFSVFKYDNFIIIFLKRENKKNARTF